MGISDKTPCHDDFNGASGTDAAQEDLRAKLSGYYLVRSYAADAAPYDVISDLPAEEGQCIAVKNDPVRGADNYQQRLRTEEWLHENAVESGVAIDKATPAYFAFTNDPDAIIAHTREHAPHKEIIVLPADQLDLSNWSFTMDDHFFADFDDPDAGSTVPSHAQPHPLHGRVLNAAQLAEALETYGYPDDPYQNNFEAQMWAAAPTLAGQDQAPCVHQHSVPKSTLK